MSTIPANCEQRVVLRSVSWKTYEALVAESQGGGRITYDQGILEIMSPGMPHETAKRLLGRMIETFSLQHGIAIKSSSSTTFKRSELKRGFEADESYYIQHEQEVRGIGEIDLTIHPPPDLVLEIDMTNSSIPKRPLFAAMRIPEVWRYDGQELTLSALERREYVLLEASRVLPGFPVATAAKLLDQRAVKGETKLLQEFLRDLDNPQGT